MVLFLFGERNGSSISYMKHQEYTIVAQQGEWCRGRRQCLFGVGNRKRFQTKKNPKLLLLPFRPSLLIQTQLCFCGTSCNQKAVVPYTFCGVRTLSLLMRVYKVLPYWWRHVMWVPSRIKPVIFNNVTITQKLQEKQYMSLYNTHTVSTVFFLYIKKIVKKRFTSTPLVTPQPLQNLHRLRLHRIK